LSFLGQAEQFKSTGLVEDNQFGFFHLFENLHDMTVCAVNLLCKSGCIDVGVSVLQAYEQKCWLVSEKNIEHVFVDHITPNKNSDCLFLNLFILDTAIALW